MLRTQLAGIIGELISLLGKEKDLIDSVTTIKEALKEANYHASRLIHSLEEVTKTPKTRTTIELPKFDTYGMDVTYL